MAHRSPHAITKVYYELYAKLCQGSAQYYSIAKVSWGSHGITAPLASCEPGRVTTPNSHSSEQGTLPTSSLISKQACLPHCLQWLGMMTMTSALRVRAPAMVADCHHLALRGWTLAQTGAYHRSGGALVHNGGCLGLLLVMELIIACGLM
jgi:hypothetical protein